MSSITQYAAAEIDKLDVCAFSFTARLNGSNLSMSIPMDRIRCRNGNTCLYPVMPLSSILQLSCNAFSLRFSDLKLENSATIFLGSYRYCLMFLSTAKSLVGSSEDRCCLLNSVFNCLYSFMVCISTFVLSKTAHLCLISSSLCFSSCCCLRRPSNSSSDIDSNLDNQAT